MNTVRTVSDKCCAMGPGADSDPKLTELSGFLTEWIEQNSEVINKQFSYAVRETERRDTNKDEIAMLFVSEMIKQGLAYVASAEKENAMKRQAEGIKAAKERGVHFGRQKIEIPAEFYPLYFRYKKGELSSRECGEKLNISHSTFLKWIKEADRTM